MSWTSGWAIIIIYKLLNFSFFKLKETRLTIHMCRIYRRIVNFYII